MIENQLKNLALPPGQGGKCESKQIVNLGLVKRFIRTYTPSGIRFSVFRLDVSEIEEQLSPSPVGGRSPNDGKQPGLKSGFPIVACPLFQDLEIDGLEDTLGVAGITPTTAQRPAVTLRMKLFKLRFQCEIVHYLARSGPTSRFLVLVVPTRESYDTNLGPDTEITIQPRSRAATTAIWWNPLYENGFTTA